MPASIFSGTSVKLLKNVLRFFGGNQITYKGSVDPSAVATAGNPGDQYIQDGNPVIYVKQDAGTTTNWSPLSTATSSGDVTGPASSTDNAVARFDGTTGKIIQDSGASIDDSGNITANNLSGTNTGDQTITLTGDVTGSGTGSFAATIAADAVTNAKLADMPNNTIKGNDSGGADNPQDLTGTEVTALLDNFVGDSGSGGVKGLVPAPATGDATKFLRGDATWVTIAAGGDVTGPGSSTDEAFARFDGLTGKIIQNSVATLTDAGVASGFTQLNVDNLRLDGNTLSSTDTNGNLVLDADGTGVIQALDQVQHRGETAARFYDSDNSNFAGIKAPTAVTADYTLTLPDAGAPLNRQALISDTAELLTFDTLEQNENIFTAGDSVVGTTANFSTGNNATFNGGGTLDGTFAQSSTAAELIAGTSVYKFTQTGSSLNDYIASTDLSIPVGRRDRVWVYEFEYKYDGSDSDIGMYVRDLTNGTNLVDNQPLQAYDNANDTARKVSIRFYVPATTQTIRIGFQVKVANNGKILLFDRVKARVAGVADQISTLTDYTPTFGAGFGTPTDTNFKYQLLGSLLFVHGSFVTGTVAASPATISLPSGFEWDTDSIDTDALQQVWGDYTAFETSGTPDGTYDEAKHGVVTYNSAAGTFTLARNTASNAIVADSGSSIFSNTQRIDVTARIPVKLASASITQMSNQSKRIAIIKDRRAVNTAGDTLTTNNTYQAKVLNTMTGVNHTGFASLASNQITLQPGTYYFRGHMFHGNNNSNKTEKTKLRNTTDSTDTIIGGSTQNIGNTNNTRTNICEDVFTIAAVKVFEFQFTSNIGSGTVQFPASNITIQEEYASVYIEKLA